MFKDAEALERFRNEAQDEAKTHRSRVLICMTGCRSMGAIELGQTFREKVAATELSEVVEIVDVGCHGQCVLAPAVVIHSSRQPSMPDSDAPCWPTAAELTPRA
jgi:NADH:ubiquinone oxidoreductase subunit E